MLPLNHQLLLKKTMLRLHNTQHDLVFSGLPLDANVYTCFAYEGNFDDYPVSHTCCARDGLGQQFRLQRNEELFVRTWSELRIVQPCPRNRYSDQSIG